MNLYYITQTHVGGYDTYSDAVVAAEDERAARLTHPDKQYVWLPAAKHEDLAGVGGWADRSDNTIGYYLGNSTWPRPEHVTARLIGVADPGIQAGVICASFHAG